MLVFHWVVLIFLSHLLHLQELEKLALKFEGNILDAVKSYKKLISDRKYVEGLPVTTLALAARAATTKVSLY